MSNTSGNGETPKKKRKHSSNFRYLEDMVINTGCGKRSDSFIDQEISEMDFSLPIEEHFKVLYRKLHDASWNARRACMEVEESIGLMWAVLIKYQQKGRLPIDDVKEEPKVISIFKPK